MPSATIDVQFVNQPKPGGKMGSIKSADGEYYNVWPNKLPEFQPGGTYTVDYTERTGQDGKVWKTVAAIRPPEKPLSQARGITPANGHLPKGPVRPESSAGESERIWACAMLKSFIEAGQIELTTTSLVMATKTIREAYRQTFGNPQRADDMNDEIPI